MERSSNPAFSDAAIGRVGRTSSIRTMTKGGTYLKTLILLIILTTSTTLSWQWTNQSILTNGMSWLPMWLTSIAALIVGMMISYNPRLAPGLAPIYAIIEGALLGVVSGLYAQSLEGIVGQAVFTTLAVFLAVYIGYITGLLKATAKFQRILITAILGYIAFSFLSWILALFGIASPLIYSYGTWGIIFSIVIVIIAALSLVLDFDFIDQAATAKYPKYFEWYGAYGLMLGLIWLYLEILRLLAKLAASRSQN